MNWEQKSLRFGSIVVACAIFLRLLSGGALNTALNFLTSPTALSCLLFLETGRIVRQPEPEPPTQETSATDPTQQTQPEATQDSTLPTPPEGEQAAAVFSPADAGLVEVNSVCGYDANVEDYLQTELAWNLNQAEPTVLIVHSHATESYENTEDYQASSQYRTYDLAYNVVSVGDRLVQVLQQQGIQVVHDRTLHDAPSYSDAYANARKSIADYLEQYPSIVLVLDIHRDAVEDYDGEQMRFAVDAGEQSVAQLMMVVGTDAGGLSHPRWPENMSLAVKLHAQLEKLVPGICRPISFRSQRFNQDLSPGALIVEVGATGNTRQEALLAAEYLGQAIGQIAGGATTAG